MRKLEIIFCTVLGTVLGLCRKNVLLAIASAALLLVCYHPFEFALLEQDFIVEKFGVALTFLIPFFLLAVWVSLAYSHTDIRERANQDWIAVWVGALVAEIVLTFTQYCSPLLWGVSGGFLFGICIAHFSQSIQRQQQVYRDHHPD